MATFQTIEEIEAWQLARQLCQEIHVLCLQTPLSRDFKLREQVEAASGSIMDNIAEGFGRGGNKEFIHFLEIAHASCAETQSQLYRIHDKAYIDKDWFSRLYRLAKRTNGAIAGLIRYLQKSNFRGPRYGENLKTPK